MKTLLPCLKFLWLLCIPICLIGVCPAYACGGGGDCGGFNDDETLYNAINQGYASLNCTSAVSMAMLSPGNDTRVNLMLLMLDLHGVPPAAKASSDNPPQFGIYEFRDMLFPPSNNRSSLDNDYSSFYDSYSAQLASAKNAFNAGIKGEIGLPPSERDVLIQLREQMTTGFSSARQVDSTQFAAIENQIHSKIGKAYLRYLIAAAAFYREDYSEAASGFAALTKAGSAWVRETATYLLARTAVRVAQSQSFDIYGNVKQDWRVDPAVASAANKALNAYLSAYPKGLYANSARGLKRRVTWLARDFDRLAVDYARLIAQDRATRNMNDGELAQEIENKLLFKRDGVFSNGNVKITDPILLTVIDLYRMRQLPPGEDAQNYPYLKPITREALLAQRPHFAGQEALFDFLLATYAFYVERNLANVLTLIPEESGQASLSYLQFSRQMLRGLAGEQDEQAREHYVNMVAGANLPFQRSALELAIALIDQNSRQVERIFATDSLVRNRALRGAALSYFADAPLLRKLARDDSISENERKRAIFVLLYKELMRGFYTDFLHDMADFHTMPSTSQQLGAFLAPVQEYQDSYDCPTLKDIAATLARNADHARAKICLAEFLQLYSFNPFVFNTAAVEGWSGYPSLLPNKTHSRLTVYRSVIADPEAPSEDKAYALYRAVHCYKYGRNDYCGGEEAELAERKAWFTQLKKQYPKSEWAKKLKYYW